MLNLFYSRKFHRKTGSVLILALWMITVLAALSLSLAQSVQQKITFLRHLEEREVLRTMMESAAQQIVSEFKSSRFEDLLLGKGPIKSAGVFPFESGEVAYEIMDENRKVNINTATADILKNLFHQVANLGTDPAERLAYAVIDYRDADNAISQYIDAGSEKEGYESSGLPPPKNIKFEFPSELLGVKGVTKETYNSVKDYITIYGSGRLNVNTADATMLQVFGLTSGLADKIIMYRKGDDLRPGTEDDRSFGGVGSIEKELGKIESLTSAESSLLLLMTGFGSLAATADYYRVIMTAHLKNGKVSGSTLYFFSQSGSISSWVES